MITICTVLLFLAALCLTLYPLISNYVNQKYASQIHTAYQEVMEQVDDAALLRTKELAVAYNRSIVPGASTEDAYSQEGLKAASQDYDSQLDVAGNGIMGYVEIPKISVNLPIYHGTENDSLERGIGHLLGSSLPVGGENTHTILSGHSGMASQKMFTDLEQLIIDRYNADKEPADQLPHIPFHGLRHTSATLLIAAHQDVRTVSNRLGHAQASTTMNIYAHALKENDRTASNALENKLCKTGA